MYFLHNFFGLQQSISTKLLSQRKLERTEKNHGLFPLASPVTVPYSENTALSWWQVYDVMFRIWGTMPETSKLHSDTSSDLTMTVLLSEFSPSMRSQAFHWNKDINNKHTPYGSVLEHMNSQGLMGGPAFFYKGLSTMSG